MIVIKLGGSLLTSGWLLRCLDKIDKDKQGRTVVIVPGGGVFADQVRTLQRELNFNDRAAHCMALLAMRQAALIINALKPDFALVNHYPDFVNLGRQNRISIWSPDVNELDADGVPSSWEVTSDSLAAWLAGKVGAEELILVKSVKIEANFGIRKLAEENIVDAAFFEFTQQAPYPVKIVHAAQFIG